jgi:hypothetical protein
MNRSHRHTKKKIKKVKLSLYQAVEAHRDVRRRGDIMQNIKTVLKTLFFYPEYSDVNSKIVLNGGLNPSSVCPHPRKDHGGASECSLRSTVH